MANIDAQAGLARARTKSLNTPGTCLGFDFWAYGSVDSIGPGHGHYTIAINGWVYADPATRHEGDRNPPVGVPVYFGVSPTRTDKNKNAGDVAISLGGGLIFVTDVSGATGHTGIMTIAAREKQTSRSYLGWTSSFLGHTLVNIGPVIGASVPAGQAPVGLLTVDGILGHNTIRRWQEVLHTPTDGIISPVSTLVRAVQNKINAAGYRPLLVVDGKGIAQNGAKTKTIDGLQWYLHTTRDGSISKPSSGVIKALQKQLNSGSF